MPSDIPSHSPDLAAENLAKLKALFPEAVTEDGVNAEVLRQLIGKTVITEADPAERYGLNWHGKKRARQIALTPSSGTLRPCPDDSVDWDTTQNLMIEGDNLEVLKLLQKSYAGKVKLIYIDPPYNTGKDFVYPDDFRNGVDNYLQLTCQKQSDGRKIDTNSESNGRFHTDWLNMMYPRLKLARSLLKDDGVIFVSIDDNEMPRMNLLMDDVFGSENFIGNFIWEKKKKPSFLSKMGTVTEYIVAYAKKIENAPDLIAGVTEEGKKYPINNAGNGIKVLNFPAGSVSFKCMDQVIPSGDMSGGNIITKLLDSVEIKDGKNLSSFQMEGEWRYSQETLLSIIQSGDEISISKLPFRPNHIKKGGEVKKTANFLSYRNGEIPTNEDATEELSSLLGAPLLDYPKPTGLISFFCRTLADSEALVLDFFAGSGTTGHAVMAQNAADGGNRRYICVQLPEQLSPDNKEQKVAADFCINTLRKTGKNCNIAELTKERLRRAAKKIKEENPLFTGDLGFRVFKLAESNLAAWDATPPPAETAPEAANAQVADLLENAVGTVKAGRTEHDLLFEVLLKCGIELSRPVATRTIAGKTVHTVDSGLVFACLDAAPITAANRQALADGIIAWSRELKTRDTYGAGTEIDVFLRDDAFAGDDESKANLTAALTQALAPVRVRSL